MKNSKSKILSLLLAIAMLMANISPVFASATNRDESTKISNVGNTGRYQSIAQRQQDKKVRVVVELNDRSITDYAHMYGKSVKELSTNQVQTYENKILDKQENVMNALERNNIATYSKGDEGGVEADYQYTTLLNGFSTYVNSEDIPKIERLREVKNVYYVNEYYRPIESPSMAYSNHIVKSQEAWNLGYKGEGMVVAVLDSGYDLAHPDFKITDSSKVALTQSKVNRIKRVHSLPGKYYNEKFPYCYNYIDGTDRIKNTINNHGQHVAGTIAANGEVKGVAPEAQLLGMKVFSDDPLIQTVSSDIWIKAMDDAVKLGADAINMSLGAPAGNHIYGGLEDLAINRAREEGVVVAIAAGNEHSIITGADNFRNIRAGSPNLPYAKNPDTAMIATPALYNGDLSVASINNTNFHARVIHYEIGENKYDAHLSIAAGSPDPANVLKDTYTAKDIVVINRANMGDKAQKPGDAASFEGKEVTNKIVLVERGNSFAETLENATARNAKAVLVYNNANRDDPEVLINMLGGENAEIPLMMTTNSNGQRIIDNLNEVRISFPKEEATVTSPTAKQISMFTSWGPTPELKIKPELAAPGGDIYSLDNGESYTTMSGTSMATPHVAGGLAVVNQRLKNDKDLFGFVEKSQRANLSKIILMNTARPALSPEGITYLVRQQGAGVMDLERATTIDTYVVDRQTGEGKSEVGSIDGTKITLNYTIYNRSKEARTFKVNANALTDAKEFIEGIEYTLEMPEELENIIVTTDNEYVVPAQGKKEVRVTIDFTEAAYNNQIKLNSFIEGFVTFESTDGHIDMSVPYLGFYGNFEELKVLDEPLYNLFDDDRANDPFFTTTQLVYQENGEITFPTNTANPAWINTSQTAIANSGLGMQITPLRNYDRIEFAVEDEAGNVLEGLGQINGGVKVTGLAFGRYPFFTPDESFWNGHINGKALAEGQSVYLASSAYFSKNSKAQKMRFEVRADNKFPEAGPIGGDLKTRNFSRNQYSFDTAEDLDVNVGYDQATNTINFRAKDDKSGSGINRITIVNLSTGENLQDPKMWTWKGDQELGQWLRKSGDKYDGTYSIELWEDFQGDFILVEIADAAENVIQGYVSAPLTGVETEEAEELPAPTIFYNQIETSQYLANGFAHTPYVNVTLERRDEEGAEIVGKAIANELGFFTIDLATAKLNAGETLYLYYELDGKRSAVAEIPVVEPQAEPEVDEELEALMIYLYSPESDSTHNGPVPFVADFFGWDNIDRITFNGSELPFTVLEEAPVFNPKDNSQVFYGKVYKVHTELDLKEGYYDIPIIAHDDKNQRELGITRRFYVDKQAPVIKKVTANDDIVESVDENGNKVYTITTDKNEVEVNFNVTDNGPDVRFYRNDTLIVGEYNYNFIGLKFEPAEFTVNEVIKLGNDKETSFEYKALDNADNTATVTINVIKKEKVVDREAQKPVINASDRSLLQGETFNPMYLVTATDYLGNDITDKVEIEGTVDTNKAGEYEVTYQVTDDAGNTSQKTIKVKVLARKTDSRDKSKLIARIKEAEAMNPADYTLGSYQQLIFVTNEARAMEKSISAKQTDIDNMTVKLDKQIKRLVYITDLQNLYDQAQQLLAANPNLVNTAKSTLEQRAEEARLLLADANASQINVAIAQSLLQDAIDGLGQAANTADLGSLIEKIENAIATGEISADKYTDESIAKLQNLLDEAKNVAADDKANQEELDQARANLLSAYENLQAKPADQEVNKNKLLLVYAILANSDLTGYTEESANNLRAALEAADRVLTDESASQEEVDNALTAINDAVAKLTAKVVDKSGLESAITKARRTANGNITEAGKAKLEEAINKATEVLNKSNVSQDEIDHALADLNKVLEDVNKNESGYKNILGELLKEAELYIDDPQYSASDRLALRKSYGEANETYKSRKSTDRDYQRQISNMKAALRTFKRKTKIQ